MKRKKVENLPAPKTRRKGWWVILQETEGILIFNVFQNGKLYARHCFRPDTGEHETLKDGEWTKTRIESAIDTAYDPYGTWRSEEEAKDRFRLSKEDAEAVIEKAGCGQNILSGIAGKEYKYNADQRAGGYRARENRVDRMMGLVPEVPEGIMDFVYRTEWGSKEYCLKGSGGKYTCSICRKEFDRPAGKDREEISCPECGRRVTLLTRKKSVKKQARVCYMQNIDEDLAVARHFKVLYEFEPAGIPKRLRRFYGCMELAEEVRVIFYRRKESNPWLKWRKHRPDAEVFYEQYYSPAIAEGELNLRGNWWHTNTYNKRAAVCYLLGEVREALAGTRLEGAWRFFEGLKESCWQTDANALMCLSPERLGRAELLLKGRFRRLLRDMSIRIWEPKGSYHGNLNLDGETERKVFGLSDRQKINRIRERDGGKLVLDWMQWSEAAGQKVGDDALDFFEGEFLTPKKLDENGLLTYFTIEQAKNYLKRQKTESYKGKNASIIADQYGDYLDMCRKLHKDLNDAMVYRPRDLKRRHDEAVAEIERRQAEIKAEEYSKKFGEAEAVLREVREKFEYRGGEYFIKVPERIADIVQEGNELHHCVGSTDRYFDRIKQHETYICFLRKTKEPDTPYYTVEVEPGGTIRQHRGLYDEEPEFDRVKPFLQEWQREIKKRMREEDRKRAAVAAVKREENIRELREKNNTRVLKALEEDLMEAI